MNELRRGPTTPPSLDPDDCVVESERLLRQGEPLLSYNVSQSGLERWPEHVRLAQLQALALARSGDIERANSLLAALAARGLHDTETLGMLARTYKDLALRTSDPQLRATHLRAGFELYDSAYRAAKDVGALEDAYYTGINAATMAVFMNDRRGAEVLARDTIEICRAAAVREQSPQAGYWRLATQGEAKLILGLAQEAARDYEGAAGLAERRYGDLSTTRRQAALLCTQLGLATDWLDQVLAIPSVLVFTGHMIDRRERPAPRFPSVLEPYVRDAIAAHLNQLRPLAAYGSAACGADILCLEEMHRLGGETHVILPFPPPEFRKVSVEFAEGDWSSRFERALEVADTITVTSDHHARDSIAPFEYANQVLTGMGRLRAEQLETETQGLAVIQPNTEVVPGGAASVLAMWQTLDFRITYVPLTGHHPPVATSTEIVIAAAPRAARSVNPHGQAHVIRSLLFADVVGYTLLSEDHIPNYVSGFLGAVAELNRRTEHMFEHIETSGDGLYAVFTDAVTAGLYAVQLSEMVKSTDWEQHGLPASFSIRVALHCGPVYRGRDPITGAAIYTGPHVSRAARIEPVTPGGQVYASSAFAAVAAASGDDRLDMRYIGRLPLAKSYGSLGLYHVLARR